MKIISKGAVNLQSILKEIQTDAKELLQAMLWFVNVQSSNISLLYN